MNWNVSGVSRLVCSGKSNTYYCGNGYCINKVCDTAICSSTTECRNTKDYWKGSQSCGAQHGKTHACSQSTLHGCCGAHSYRVKQSGSDVCCVCNSGYGDCDSNRANGCETNLNTDNKNCGACGNECKSGETCKNGKCVSGGCTNECNSGDKKCDGNNVYTCYDSDSDGCREWTYAKTCSVSCINGLCYSNAPGCTATQSSGGNWNCVGTPSSYDSTKCGLPKCAVYKSGGILKDV